jgi:hypothetical protein
VSEAAGHSATAKHSSVGRELGEVRRLIRDLLGVLLADELPARVKRELQNIGQLLQCYIRSTKSPFRYHVPVSDPEKERRAMAYLEGRLRGHTGGAEGEHAGHVLEVEVDMSAVEDAGEMADEQVAVTGDVVIVDYPERGKVMVFRATSAAAMDEEPG